MRETIELRVLEKHASRVFAPNEGRLLGTGGVRKVEIPAEDPRIPEIARVDRELSEAGEGSLFFGWTVRRRYLRSELARAELLHLWISAVFEPAGEETGTAYDESGACPYCGAGRMQVGELCLDTGRIPKRADLAGTIADEVVFSRRLAGIMADRDVSGLTLLPIRQQGQGGRITPEWLQPEITSRPLEVIEPTQYGVSPFDHDLEGRFQCPLGHTAGLNLISELYLDRSTWSGEDFCATRQLVGVSRGLLRPRPSLLISQRLYLLLRNEKARGFKVEVAHLV